MHSSERQLEHFGPTGSFMALAPVPAWLRHDLALAAQKIPTVQTLVLFGDDLPDYHQLNGSFHPSDVGQARRDELTAIATRAFGQPPSDLGVSVDHACTPNGEIKSNAAKQDNFVRDNVLRTIVNHISILQPPTHAIIMLPGQGRQPLRDLFLTTGIDLRNTTSPVRDINYIRPVLWHELGHLAQQEKKHAAMSVRLNERNADTLAYKGSLLAGDPIAAQYSLDWRALSTFLSPLCNGAMDYWNSLSVLQPEALGHAETAAYLEVKARATGLPLQLPRKPEAILHKVNDFGGWQPVSNHFARIVGTDADNRILTLAELHKRVPYKYPHSHALAEMVLGAAYRIAPRRFADCRV